MLNNDLKTVTSNLISVGNIFNEHKNKKFKCLYVCMHVSEYGFIRFLSYSFQFSP